MGYCTFNISFRKWLREKKRKTKKISKHIETSASFRFFFYLLVHCLKKKWQKYRFFLNANQFTSVFTFGIWAFWNIKIGLFIHKKSFYFDMACYQLWLWCVKQKCRDPITFSQISKMNWSLPDWFIRVNKLEIIVQYLFSYWFWYNKISITYIKNIEKLSHSKIKHSLTGIYLDKW